MSIRRKSLYSYQDPIQIVYFTRSVELSLQCRIGDEAPTVEGFYGPVSLRDRRRGLRYRQEYQVPVPDRPMVFTR